MGTYSSIFIEFKKKDQWHLLEAAVPLTFVDHSYSEMSPDDMATRRSCRSVSCCQAAFSWQP